MYSQVPYLLFRKITSSNYNWNKLIPIVRFYNEIERRRLGESCEGHLQCSGTVNAGVCGSYKTCTCNQGFFASHAGCLQGKYFFFLKFNCSTYWIAMYMFYATLFMQKKLLPIDWESFEIKFTRWVMLLCPNIW